MAPWSYARRGSFGRCFARSLFYVKYRYCATLETLVFDVVLFDFDGVIRHFQRSRVPVIEAATGLPSGSIQAAAFAGDLLVPATTGAITDEAWRALIVERLAASYPDSAASEAVRQWSESIGVIDDAMLEIVRACRSRHKVGLVSNATSRLLRDMEALDVDHEFDLVVSSAKVGAIKPDRRIFDVAVQKLGTTHSRAVFIDDTLGHVEAALTYGMSGFVHESNETSRERFVDLGIL